MILLHPLINLFGSPKYGFVLISNSQHLKSSSIMKSYPKSSKQGERLLGFSVFLPL